MIDEYLSSMKSYKKNRHFLSEELITKIKSEWGFTMKEWGYDTPEHIEIMKDE